MGKKTGPRLQCVPNRHRQRPSDDVPSPRLSAEEWVLLRGAVLTVIEECPLELYRIVSAVKVKPKRVAKILGALISEKVIVRHPGRLPQYGLRGSQPAKVDGPRWVTDAITSKPKVAAAKDSWWIGKDRSAFKDSSPYKEG